MNRSAKDGSRSSLHYGGEGLHLIHLWLKAPVIEVGRDGKKRNVGGGGWRTGRWFPHVLLSKRSCQKIKDRITELTQRKRTAIPLDWVVNEVNATVRGWVGCFHYRNCSRSLGRIRNHLEQRMITHLRKRYKVRDRKAGYVRFPYRSLYEHYGLYRVPTTAALDKAHAL